MEENKVYDVCSVEHAGMLDNKFRRWTQNPNKILKPYIKPGMKVMDLGCGPGFFTIEMAKMVGEAGAVTAVDLQSEMLEIIDKKASNDSLTSIIELHQCTKDTIGVYSTFDFIFAFYVIHEIPDKERLWKEIKSLLSPMGKMLIVEPPFHVNRKAFLEMRNQLKENGLRVRRVTSGLLNKAILVENINK